jgi:hypothetical protein
MQPIMLRPVVPNEAVLFSIAGLSGGAFGAVELYRLRQIVEFSFATTLLAVGVIPLASLLGSVEVAARVGGVLAIVLLLVHSVVLGRRLRRSRIVLSPAIKVVVVVVDGIALVGAFAAAASGAMSVYQVALIPFLARPMVAFLMVLGSLESG